MLATSLRKRDVNDSAAQPVCKLRDHSACNAGHGQHHGNASESTKQSNESEDIGSRHETLVIKRKTVRTPYASSHLAPGSLEADISTLRCQRDKSLRIFEEIRESLDGIQYYDTVTNLKVRTSRDDYQLQVNVREDEDEIINFPNISMFAHVRCPCFNECILTLDSHVLGFVYKVSLNGRVVVKKEIPDPDSINDFLYQVNALDSLQGASNVVQLVADGRGELIKGLLISYAPHGSLSDMISELTNSNQSSWNRIEKWARQIVTGLSNIHQAGFVHGDFTLSNILIDDNDDAQIIDMNQRGCPHGWEPPELARLIYYGQRIRKYIGIKKDTFQMGMVLWALAEQDDEPENAGNPLRPAGDSIPAYMTATCLSQQPQNRLSAKYLLDLFPNPSD